VAEIPVNRKDRRRRIKRSLTKEPGYGVDLFEDDDLFLLPAADLRMDSALSLFAYLGNTPQLDRSIERRHI
jgi:hypothetical protein